MAKPQATTASRTRAFLPPPLDHQRLRAAFSEAVFLLRFSRFSLKFKLGGIMLATSGTVLVLASLGFIFHDVHTFRRDMLTDLRVLADLAGQNSVAGLLFNDAITAEENLAVLKANRHIVFAHIFNQEGQWFASYRRDPDSNPPWDLHLGKCLPRGEQLNEQGRVAPDLHAFSARHLDVFQVIILDRDFVGTVYIRSDLDAFYQRLRGMAWIVAAILGVSLLIGIVLASGLQRIITAPVLALLATMQTVARQKQYSVRAEKRSEDELGRLVDGFNQMLEQIEKRDAELDGYRAHLEEKVSQRTAELTRRGEELEAARDEALAANKAKSVFLANMSHELRTPLNGILGYTQILQRNSQLPTAEREGIGVIQRSGEYLLTLINDILDLSKVEAGRIELNPEPCLLPDFLREVTEVFRIRAQQKGIGFHYHAIPELPRWIQVDAKRLRQIVMNLLGNAIKFTDQGEVIFTAAREGEHLMLTVQDSGIGIVPEDLESIFQPFKQSGDILHKAEGTGLGLSITKNLVTMMGGAITVDSELGQGSRFQVTLPWTEWEGAETQGANDVDPAIIVGYQPKPPKNEPFQLLVVDDKAENRAVLVNLLAPLGFQLTEVEHGGLAVAHCDEHRPDLVFMDLMMPVMDGFAATTQLKQRHPDLPVIAISASVFGEDHERARRAGCDEFVNKPFQADALLAMIARLLPLTWIRAETERDFPAPSPPSATQIDELREYLLRGNFSKFQHRLEQMREETPALSAFCEQARQLALAFDEEGLEALLSTSVSENALVTEEIPAPSREQAERLHVLSLQGDIDGILDFANELEQSTPELHAFTRQIRELARAFDERGLTELVEPYLEHPQ